MLTFLNIIARFREAFLLLVYIIFSFVFMTTSDSAISEGLRSSAAHTIGNIETVFVSLHNYFELEEKNTRLRQENTRLSYENFNLRDALLENIRLRKLLDFKYQQKYKLVPARVIGFSPQSLISGLLLSSESITPAMKNTAVMTAEGLVGKIVDISGKFAICQIMQDPNIRVSARVQRNRELGIIKWDGSNGFLLDQIPNTIDIRVGDVIFTSGYSQIYPAHIKIGIVSHIEINNQFLFQKINVIPAVNFKRLEEVLIYLPQTRLKPNRMK